MRAMKLELDRIGRFLQHDPSRGLPRIAGLVVLRGVTPAPIAVGAAKAGVHGVEDFPHAHRVVCCWARSESERRRSRRDWSASEEVWYRCNRTAGVLEQAGDRRAVRAAGIAEVGSQVVD